MWGEDRDSGGAGKVVGQTSARSANQKSTATATCNSSLYTSPSISSLLIILDMFGEELKTLRRLGIRHVSNSVYFDNWRKF